MQAVPRPIRLFLKALKRLAINARTLAREQGFSRSVREGLPVDASGAALPWYTYPAIEYLGQFDFRGRAVFEYGAGNSSHFWTARGAAVCAVENDERWYAELAASVPRLEIELCRAKDDYVGSIARRGRAFDLIAIDGVWRRACANAAPAHLAPGGAIVMDNSDRHPQATADLRARGFLQVDFNGFGPVNAYAWTTSLFVKADWPLQRAFRDPAPVGGLREYVAEDDDAPRL